MKKSVIFLLTAFVTLNLTARTPAGGPDPGPAVFAKAPSGVKVSPLVEAKFKQLMNSKKEARQPAIL